MNISIKPIEPLVLNFQDGVVKKAIFNNEAFITFTDEFGPIDDHMQEAITRPYDFGAKLLYAGLKVFDKEVTYEEAESIIVAGGEELLEKMTSLTIDNFMVSADENSKKKLMDQLQEINKAMSL